METNIELINSSTMLLNEEEQIFLRSIPANVSLNNLSIDALRLLIYYISKSGPFDVAVDSGYFKGTLQEWLASLKSNLKFKSYVDTYSQLATLTNLEEGDLVFVTDTKLVYCYNGVAFPPIEDGFDITGPSAYDIAVQLGFVGAQEDWIESLKGEKLTFADLTEADKLELKGPQGEKGTTGDRGDSAYTVALQQGFIGTKDQWLDSLKGSKGDVGPTGKSLFDLAVENGYTGTLEDWLADEASLKQYAEQAKGFAEESQTYSESFKVYMQNGGQLKAYDTAAELLATTPTETTTVAYAFDTKKMYLWKNAVWKDEGYSQYDLSKSFTRTLEENATTKNLFNFDEIIGKDFSRVTSVAGRNALSKVNNGIKISVAANTTVEVRYRFSASYFKDANVVSFFSKILSLGASTGAAVQAARMFIWQTNAAGASIQSDSFLIAGSEAVTDKDASLQVTLNSNAVYVEVGFSVQAVVARDLVFAFPCVSASSNPQFTRPTSIPQNLFPDPKFSGQYSSVFHGFARVVDDVDIMTFEETSVLRQSLYQIPATGQFAPKSIVRFGADVLSNATGATHMTIVFFNAAGAEITRSTQASRIADVYDTLSSEFVVPDNCVRVDVRLMKDTNATKAQFKNVFLYSNNQERVSPFPRFAKTILYVDQVNGSDTYNGTQTAPLKTLDRAIKLCGVDSKIILEAGDYYERVDITSKISNLEVYAARHAKVRIIGGTRLNGFTKVDGYTKVYQMTMATSPLLASDRSGYWFYQLDTPDINTIIIERFKHHEGRTQRLPDVTQIWKADSIAAIESATVPSWYWADGILYLSCVGGVDPNTVHIRMPDPTYSPFYSSNTTKNQTLKLVGIESWCWISGFRTWDAVEVTLINCKAVGNRVNGFETSDNEYVTQIGCEGYANWVDGCGGHVYRENTSKKSCLYVGSDNYFHDNGDDGFSYHEMWKGSTTGMLCEYNGDRGCADAVGAHFNHISPIFYKNGQGFGKWAIDDGAGIACVGTAIDGGSSTDTQVSDGLSIGNIVNYSVASGSASTNTMRLNDCKSIDPVTTHYNCAYSTLIMTDCKVSGQGNIKLNTNGNIKITNTTLVT